MIQPLPPIQKLVQEQIIIAITDLRAELEVQYDEQSRKQWAKMMEYLLTYYAPPHGSPKDSPPPPLPTAPTFSNV